MTGVPRLRALRNKLALVFFLITGLAFGVIYFIVVPQLQSNLEQREMRELRRLAGQVEQRFTGIIGTDVPEDVINRRVRGAADATNARVTLLGFQQSLEEDDFRFYVVSDSSEQRAVPVLNNSLARTAAEGRRTHSGFSGEGQSALAQLAQPIEFRGEPAWVVLYSRDLGDVADTVAFIRDRVLVASAIALLLALVGSYLVAFAVSRRVRRLEQGAKEVAEGRFTGPLPVDSEDELGQLTRTFNEMQEQLRQVDVARKEFVATASHELRTPIFSLAGFVELLQDEELDDDTRREFLDTMGEQVARLQKLSVDLLDLSRLDAGSVEVHREPVDLSELARSVLGEFKPALAEHGAKLELRLPEAGLKAACDPERVAQIMRILLDNALRHTPEGTPISVSANRNNGAAELTVADRGPGLPEGASAHVFERFYTGDATRGAGLGLAIAQELAELMEGRLRLRAENGNTSFTLELPGAGA